MPGTDILEGLVPLATSTPHADRSFQWTCPGLSRSSATKSVVDTSVGKQFVGTLTPIVGSASTVMLIPLPADQANNFQFAINGVNALDIGAISFVQDLSQPH